MNKEDQGNEDTQKNKKGASKSQHHLVGAKKTPDRELASTRFSNSVDLDFGHFDTRWADSSQMNVMADAAISLKENGPYQLNSRAMTKQGHRNANSSLGPNFHSNPNNSIQSMFQKRKGPNTSQGGQRIGLRQNLNRTKSPSQRTDGNFTATKETFKVMGND